MLHAVHLTLSEDELLGLDAVAADLGVRRSEVLRRGMDVMQRRHRDAFRRARLQATV